MHHPPSDEPEPDDAAPDVVLPEDVDAVVDEVIAWYTERITAERRSSVPDEDRIRHLVSARAAAMTAANALPDADETELARIASVYSVLLKKMKSDESA